MIIAQFAFRRRWLSNFLFCRVEYRTAAGKLYVYKSVEHGYQAQKATNRLDHDWIAAAKSGAEARERGRSVIRRPGFDSFKERLMLKLLWSKFRHNSYLRRKLLATRHHELVHGNMHEDLYWGVSRRTGKGDNRLGKLLMLLRDKIRDGTDDTIPLMGIKKLQRHRAYRERKKVQLEDENLPAVVRRLPKLDHEEKLAYHPSGRKRASKRKGDPHAIADAKEANRVIKANKVLQAKLRREAYGEVEPLDPDRKGTKKWIHFRGKRR